VKNGNGNREGGRVGVKRAVTTKMTTMLISIKQTETSPIKNIYPQGALFIMPLATRAVLAYQTTIPYM
jgi:hypothetical protein